MKETIDYFEHKLLRQTCLLIGIVSFASFVFDLVRGLELPVLSVTFILTIVGIVSYFLVKQNIKILFVKYFISIVSIVMLNFAWFFNHASYGPVLPLYIAWGIFIVFLWNQKMAIVFGSVMFVNLSVLFLIEYSGYPFLIQIYASSQERLVDVGIGTFASLFLAAFYSVFVKIAYLDKIKKAQEAEELKTAFLQNISHEIRSPMNAILGFSNLLQKQNLSAISKAKYIETINSSGKHLISIIDDIVKISMLETHQVEVQKDIVDVKEVMQALYLEAEMSPYLNKNVILRSPNIEISNDLTLNTDKVKFTQILQNFLTNALKYTNIGFVEFGCSENSSSVEFYVKDTGVGIKKSDSEIIFDRFRQVEKTANSKYKGSGLGLAICKSYVELLGGKIWFESRVGEGTTFYFTIPFQPEISPVVENSLTVNKSKKTILVAEDDEMNFNFIKIILEKSYNLLRASNGQQAVDIIEGGTHVDCILMDIRMPILNGTEAAKLIKRIRPDVHIIAQTAYTQIEDEEYFSKTSFDDYILKPINPESLNELLSFILAS